ncbi:uncharacterized protein LOC126403852 [Epinephelus moara]|uniref:uncharacterized protein LOC126403852 n=1 Tax=Epinephelus moara TaxID=300413 RepID=UPI00214E39AA|nr:uncharacterized protein LOC126403852 [Epinephelus moara]
MRKDRRTHMMWLLLLCILLLDSCTATDSCTAASDWSDCFIVGLIGGLACGLPLIISVLIVLRCKNSTIRSYIFSAKRDDLSEKKAQLQKQSQKTQEELAAWAVVLTPLMDLKRGLLSQREEFRLQLEETDREREESKEKLQLVEEAIAESEKENATDKTEGYLREKQSLLKAQWKLEKRKEELENQQLNMEKLLQKTEGLIATITERQRKVENHMELINLHLEEVESQDDKVHQNRE